MGVFVKICGICSRSDLWQISALQPDAVGFIQWSKSERYVDPKAVGQWDTPEGIKRVGVFVNPSEDELMQASETARFDILQVHRVSRDWEIDRSKFRGMKAWRALNPDDFKHPASAFKFDGYVLDSYDPQTIGGTGKPCDWKQARKIVQSLGSPVLLAGGLTPDNVPEAIKTVGPWGVDVSSGVEIEPGMKDLAKVEAFIVACRSL